jgi:hypothetical protein
VGSFGNLRTGDRRPWVRLAILRAGGRPWVRFVILRTTGGRPWVRFVIFASAQLAAIKRAICIWPIFVPAGATGRMRSSDVMGNMGEMPRLRDVNGVATSPQSSKPV